MRVLIFFFLLCSCTPPTVCHAQYVPIAFASSSGMAATTPTTTIGATLCVLGVASYDPTGSLSIWDSQGNTWILVDSEGQSGQQKVSKFAVWGSALSTSATQSFSVTCTACFPTTFVGCYSGGVVTSSPIYSTNGATNLGSGTIFGGAVSALNNFLSITICNCNQGVSTPTLSVGGGYTMIAQYTYAVSNHFCSGMAWKVVSGTTNPGWTVPGVTTFADIGNASFSSRYTNPPDIGHLIMNFNQSRK